LPEARTNYLAQSGLYKLKTLVWKILRTPSYLMLFIIFLIALIGPWFVGDPLALSAGPRLTGPTPSSPFGTDQYGMDILSRVVNGARIDLMAGLSAAMLAAVVGMPLGAFAAYRGGIWDQIMLRTSESFQAFPVLILAMGIIAALGSSMLNMILVIALVNVPVYIRLTRSAVIPLREKDFILAARCAGLSDWKILRRHVLPNVAPVIVAQFSVNCAWAIQILAALSFVGLGVKLPTPEWGAMVRGGSDYILYGQWWVSVFPGLAILITVLTLNQVADRIGQIKK
jgi:peptide/nickel transport system permease protein|tara:strand:- start:14049 stop:14900 length:852 start_codon:yes stop_codon:yes gene_type:complete